MQAKLAVYNLSLSLFELLSLLMKTLFSSDTLDLHNRFPFTSSP
jgi:hypothetical protein